MNAGEVVEKLELLHTVGRRVDDVYMMENRKAVPQTLKTVPNNAWAGYLPQKVEIEISETLTPCAL